MIRRLFLLSVIIGLLVGCEQSSQALKPKPRPKPGPSRIQEGSVIFWDRGPFWGPIYRHTNSTLSHVAIVLYVGNQPWVYEATPPRVRRISLSHYLSELKALKTRRSQFSWFMLQPRKPFTAFEIDLLKRHAESQLGRRYMMRGWWKGREVRGTMCSQYVGDVLEKSGRITSAHFRESPGSLHAKLLQLYH